MAYIRMCASLCAACVIASVALMAASGIGHAPLLDGLLFKRLLFLTVALFAFGAITAYGMFRSFLAARFSELVDASQRYLQDWGHGTGQKSVSSAIVVLSGVTLFLELVLIRWQGSLFPVFALYKNFTLLACFCGLGIGYALSHKKPQFLPLALPMLAATIFFLTVLRHTAGENLIFFVPIREETSVFDLRSRVSEAGSAFLNVPAYLLLTVTFILNVLIMLPIAQFCGHVMARARTLAGYGSNLIGSILGVAALFLLSWLWTGPVIWFAVALAPVLWFQMPLERARNAALSTGIACLIVLGYPADPMTQDIYSPYQLIQKSAREDGLMTILSAGSYFQNVFNLSARNLNRESGDLRRIVGYYELPFRTAPSLSHVVIVGAGTGNDVSAALRSGAAAVDAVEIDPAVIALGRANHPEHPYDDPRVRVVNNDARTFFRSDDGVYDTIVYGVLDSHILLSHGSNVRLDSFVYTQQGLAEAYRHLKKGGLMSVSFALPNLKMGFKIFEILRQLPGAGKPVAILTGYDTANTYTFMVRNGSDVSLPADFMKAHDLKDGTKYFLKGWQGQLDIPTDDWPFFYMDARMYPASYVVSLLLVMALAAFMVRKLLPGDGWDKTLLPFFFLGGGFMLVETKAITELGLLFGNTWHVIGIAITGVLVMAFLANLIVTKYRFDFLFLPNVLLLTAVIIGYAVAKLGGFGEAGAVSKLTMVALLTSPLLFSGIIFSGLLRKCDNLPAALSYNLMGAMLGGLLEYNSMQFGFSFLYLLAAALYLGAWITMGKGAFARASR